MEPREVEEQGTGFVIRTDVAQMLAQMSRSFNGLALDIYFSTNSASHCPEIWHITTLDIVVYTEFFFSLKSYRSELQLVV